MQEPDRWWIIVYSRLSDSTYTDFESNFLSLLVYLECTINHRINPLGYAFNLLVQGPFLFPGVSIGEEVRRFHYG